MNIDMIHGKRRSLFDFHHRVSIKVSDEGCQRIAILQRHLLPINESGTGEMSPAEVKQAIARNRRAAMAMQNFAQRQATAASGERSPDWRVARSRIPFCSRVFI
jgi:hypothetical protein